jgi:predicted negative regulator of RcsB-dependent stress response
MDNYLSEKEQIQLFKNWMKQYGVSILLGVVLALILSYGWRYWQQHQTQKAQQASLVYEQLLVAQNKQQADQVSVLAQQLMQQNARSPYAMLAAFMLAQQAVAQKNLPVAEQHLEWAVHHGHDSDLVNIAKLRLARVMLAQQQTDAALELLTTMEAENFTAEIALLKGDAYLQLKDKKSAREAYQTALQNMPATAPMRAVAQMKLDDLA